MSTPAAGDASQPSLLEPGVLLPPPGPPEFGSSAAVLIDTGLPHLDRTFDYGIPASMAADVRPGIRVRVRFAGRDRDGFVLAVGEPTQHTVHPVRRVVSTLPVLPEATLALARAVAERYAGTLSDVLRLAIPPRHARTEKSVLAALPRAATGPADPSDPPDPPGRGNPSNTAAPSAASASNTPSGPTAPAGGDEDGEADLLTLAEAEQRAQTLARAAAEWEPYAGGAAFIRRLGGGEAPRAAWCALPWQPSAAAGGDDPDGEPPGAHWAAAIAAAAAATLAGGRSALLLVPTAGEVDRLAAALEAASLEHVTLTADTGPAARYRAFLAALTGTARIVLGTRSAALAPLPDLGLVVCWDDGHDAYAEPRAPYPHAREVLAIRARQARAAALFGGYARTVETEELVRTGWLRDLSAPRPLLRAATPRVVAPDEFDLEREGAAGRARFPRPAWELTRRALASGPVLVQVPRAGYVPFVACADCREPARCGHCGGPLEIAGGDRRGGARCRWCARETTDGWNCGHCGGHRYRAGRVGSERTAEELGRAFPGVPVVVSGRAAGMSEVVDDRPRLVIATPGAEPRAAGGYRAAVLLDAALLTNRPELDAGVEALRRWLRAAALVRPDGTAMVLGEGTPAVVQAFVRWDPAGLARRELAERIELDFPPAVRMIAVTGTASDLKSFRRHCRLPEGTVELGPVPVAPEPEGPAAEAGAVERLLSGGEARWRLLLRIERARGLDLSAAVRSAQAIRSARKEGSPVRVQVDPDIV